nr:MAG TPA: hypothetical protein [Caudoviricetes sp.]
MSSIRGVLSASSGDRLRWVTSDLFDEERLGFLGSVGGTWCSL